MKEELSHMDFWGPSTQNGWSRVSEGKATGDDIREREGPRLCSPQRREIEIMGGL